MRCRVTVEPQKAEEQWGNTVVVGLLSGDFPGGLGSLRYSSPWRLSAFPVQTRAVQPDWSRAAPDPAHSGRILISGDLAGYLAPITALLRTQTGHDFSNYKERTIVRRVQRRMHVLQIDHARRSSTAFARIASGPVDRE